MMMIYETESDSQLRLQCDRQFHSILAADISWRFLGNKFKKKKSGENDCLTVDV